MSTPRAFKFLTGLMFASTLFVAPAAAAPILLNGGFETGSLAPWFASSGAPFVTNAEAHSGSFSVAALGGDAIRQNFGPVSTADIDEVSFWIKRAGSVFDSYQFFYSDLTSSSHLVNTPNPNNDWLFFDVTANLDVGKNLVGFQIFGTSPRPAFLDDFNINP